MSRDPPNPTILIVDDAPESLDVLKRILMDAYSVRPAINGQLALRLAVIEPKPDLILLDIMMPDMDGYEVCRQLKKDMRTRDIPVMFITAKSGDEDELEGLQMGAVDYITKPISPHIVLTRIKSQLTIQKFNMEMEKKNRHLYEINERLADNMEKLAASEERFRNLMQTIPDIVYKIDSEGRFTFLNKSVERLGYHQSDLIGKHFTEIIHSANIADASLAHILKRVGQGTNNPQQKLFDERRCGSRMTVGMEIRLRTKAGQSAEVAEIKNLDSATVAVEINSTGLYEKTAQKTANRTRQYVGTVGVIRDVTERQQVQKAFMEERKLFRQLMDVVPLPIFHMGNRGQVIFSNHAFRELTSVDGDDAEGLYLQDLFGDEGKPVFESLLSDVLGSSDSTLLHKEVEWASSDGTLRRLNVMLSKFYESAQTDASAMGVFVGDWAKERGRV